uniref:Membrane protein, palmitoylated 7b (MAGUK p55 subfamily member 7) n=1 Tax=Kryptolebias marmoratus TaxID=37003 RepID=A0A3Q2ZG34_KRYMA
MAVRFLTRLFIGIFESEKIPEEWRRSVLVSIFKNKGDVKSCSNYRGIKLMSHTMKIWERAVKARQEKEEAPLYLKESAKVSLLRVHDAVGQRDFEPTLSPIPDDALEEEEDSVKIVSLVKTKEPLGATIKMNKSTGAIVVARIMRGGPADKSDLIHEGDELKEVNGVSLKHRKPKEILHLLACSRGEIKFKIIPGSYKEDILLFSPQLFVRALFDYDPVDDPTIPCKGAAVAFRRGDVLHLVSMKDNSWWQACRLRDGSQQAGLIPSKQLRVALQRPKALFKPRLYKTPGDKIVLFTH